MSPNQTTQAFNLAPLGLPDDDLLLGPCSSFDIATVFDEDMKDFCPSPQADQQTKQTEALSNPFVNILMLVDPVTQKVVCPEQVLSYEVDGKTETTKFGPLVLDSLPQTGGTTMTYGTPNPLSHRVGSDSNPSPVASAPAAAFRPIAPAQQTQTQAQIAPMPPSTVSAVMGRVSPSDDSSLSSSSQSSAPSSPASQPLQKKKMNATSKGALAQAPLRALSAYNFFFRDERDRILNGGDNDYSSDKQKKLLAAHWGQDRTKKRRHRKTHGKIDFTTLSKLISTRWKELSQESKDFYRRVAAEDWSRYQKELAEYKKTLDEVASSSSSPSSAPMSSNDVSSFVGFHAQQQQHLRVGV